MVGKDFSQWNSGIQELIFFKKLLTDISNGKDGLTGYKDIMSR